MIGYSKLERGLGAMKELYDLALHIIAMADDAYLCGHPEWWDIVEEAQKAIESIKGGNDASI